MNLNELTIKKASDGLKKKEFSSVELTQACLDSIEKTDDKLKAFITVTKEQALEKAKQVDDAGNFDSPLIGIPAGLKDIFCTKDIKTTAGSKILENYTPPYSATSVKNLGDDSVIIGKLNCDEFAMGASTENSGFFPTKNPWDLTRVPGGSSGGSAVAVAADQCIYSLGTDTGGSIRQPAGFCNVTGLKVTYGRVSRYGVMAYASSFDTIGPITKTVEDAAIVLKEIAGNDPKDSTTPDVKVDDYVTEINKGIKGLKIGVPKEFFPTGIHPNVKKSVEEAINKLEELGAKRVDVSLPLTKYAIATYYILVKSEASSNMARYDGIRFGYSVSGENLLEQYLNTRREGFGPEVKRSIMLGTYTLSAGYYDAYYKKAAQVRTLIKQEFEEVLSEVDCLVGPVSPTVAFKLGEKVDDPLAMYLADIFTDPASVAGLPAISIPCGFATPYEQDSDKFPKLPVGLQIIGKQFAESTILRVGHQYQQATNWHTKKPSIA